MLAVAILAAGESRRMGTPKALLPYRGKTFVEHLIEVTRNPRVDVTRVVLGAGADKIQAQAAAARQLGGVERKLEPGAAVFDTGSDPQSACRGHRRTNSLPGGSTVDIGCNSWRS